MNYNTLFAPTACIERTAKAHVANLPTYFLIAAVILLTAIKTTLDFIATQLDRTPEYVLVLKPAKVRTAKRFITIAIRAEKARLSAVSRYSRALSLAQKQPVAILDRLFCLNS